MKTLLHVVVLALCVAFTACGSSEAEVAAVDGITRARTLVEEAEPWFEQAANTDLGASERKQARSEAYTRLKAARSLYNEFLDANPDREEEFDKEYSHMARMLHFIKKMSGATEHEPDESTR